MDRGGDPGTPAAGDGSEESPDLAGRARPGLDPDVLYARLRIEQTFARGASEFHWIAGLAVLNSVLFWNAVGLVFIFGLGVTDVVDQHFVRAYRSGTMPRGTAMTQALALDVLASAPFVAFGWFARRRQEWAFLVGMALYAADGVLLAIRAVQLDWLGVAFHGFLLVGIFQGWLALRSLRAAGPEPRSPSGERRNVWGDPPQT
ncbi:MAG: hypothetical protein L0216_06600 [Planctomycetales bacterium]|nr:hypothetical protein [Planctomycetales bacterium]